MNLALGLGLPADVGKTVDAFDNAFEQWAQLSGDDMTATDAGGGTITLVRGSGGIVAVFYQHFRTTPGVTYSLTGTIATSAMSIRVGTAVGNGSMFSQNTNTGAFDETFVASGHTAYISLWPVSENSTSSIDDAAIVPD